jgi:hypothetical protein
MNKPNPLLKYVMKVDKADVMHSSGYAQAQNAGSFGATCSSSFMQRRDVDQQRKFVQKYRNTRTIGGAQGGLRAKTYTPGGAPMGTAGAKPIGSSPPSRPMGLR